MKGQIVVQNDKLIELSVQVYFFKIDGDDCVYAKCPALALITHGKNLDHAKKMFQEAFDLWVEDVNERGNINDVLKELGWKVTKYSITPKEQPFNVPINLLASQTRKFSKAKGTLATDRQLEYSD